MAVLQCSVPETLETATRDAGVVDAISWVAMAKVTLRNAGLFTEIILQDPKTQPRSLYVSLASPP